MVNANPWGAQAALARKLGTSPQMLSQWKTGKTELSVKRAQQWANILNVHFSVLLTAPARDRPKLLGLK